MSIFPHLLYIGATQKHPRAPLAEITVQPQSLTATEGDTAVLSVEAVNATGYQWYKVGNNSSLSATSTLDLGDLSLDEAGSYYVLVFNKDNRSVKSNEVQVVVNEKPAIPLVAKWLNDTEEYGDSNSANYLITTSWGGRVASALGVTYNNHAIAGYTANQQSIIASATMPMVAVSTTAIMLGTNNFKNSTSFARTFVDIFAANRNIASAQYAKEALFYGEFTRLVGSSELIDGTPFYNDFGSRVPKAKASGKPNASWFYTANGSLGDKLTFQFTGTGFSIRSFIGASSGDEPSPIKVTVDGAVLGTWVIPFGMNKNGPDCEPFVGLTNTQHTVVLEFTKAGKQAVDSIDILKTPGESQAMPFQSNDIPHFAPQGFVDNEFATNTEQLSNQVFDELNAAVETMIRDKFKDYAFNKPHINAEGYYDANNPTHIQADGVHATDIGAQKQADCVLATFVQ